jgi:hypothetical protein
MVAESAGWGGISFLLVAVFFVDARGLRHSRSEDDGAQRIV